jgi:hypothetical protein
VTIFSSAFLLFQVQPLISKFILPWFGGSPAVWTAAMLFFQIVLFGGYLYAHLSSTRLTPRAQFIVHLLLLLAALCLAVYTRITPSQSLKPGGGSGESPLLEILLVLAASVGVPYFALSATGPLLQKWFSDSFDGASPYRLFSLSNLGSLLALLSYPFFFEVYWDSGQQAGLWSIGFGVFAASCAFCAWWTYRARQADRSGSMPEPGPASGGESPSAARRLAWIGLPALASVAFLAVTNEVCQNVATVPLLWIIPLSLYLISFIVAFDHPRWYVRPLCLAAAIAVLVSMGGFAELSGGLASIMNALLGRGEQTAIVLDRWAVECGLDFLGLLLVCLVCHSELARLKPQPRHLTSFFLSMSLGGALGGVFVNLIAPRVFTRFFEMPLAMVLAAWVAAWALADWSARFGRLASKAAYGAGLAAASLIAWWQIGSILPDDPAGPDAVIYRGRSFFGLVSVEHRSRGDQKWESFALRSGHILHGRQYADPQRRRSTEVAYYDQNSGCGRAIRYKFDQRPGCKIGVIGLGVGTIAAYGRPGDSFRFYEINPQVVEIAGRYFHYLEDSPARCDIVVGDGRLMLEQELRKTGGRGHEFDLLILDAFSGDAVPSHLLTSEAFAIYKRHLKPDGILVLHITNTYLDLYPVVKLLAAEHGFQLTRIYRPADDDSLIYRSDYALLTADEAFLRANPDSIDDLPAELRRERTVPLWTDRYHNLFQILQ